MMKVETFNDYKPARISKELYEIDKCRWRMSVPATRLLFALSQSVSDKECEIFPELGFNLDIIFKYLGITKWNNRYEVLKDALKELMENPLDIVTETKKGKQWIGVSWLERYEFSTFEPSVKIIITNSAKPFLRQLTQYSRIQPKIYLKLSSEYQNWFYPYFKQFEQLGKWKVSLSDIYSLLKIENSDAYSLKTPIGKINFFKYVLGIELSEPAKKENMLSKKEKRPAKPIVWDYVKNAKGEYTGTLFHITEKTDLNVTASCLKTGRSYTHIVFFIAGKRLKTAENDLSDSNAGADMDFGSRRNVNNRKKRIEPIRDLFETSLPKAVTNKIHLQTKSGPKIESTRKYYDIEILLKESEKLGYTLERIIKMMNLKRTDDGQYYKEY